MNKINYQLIKILYITEQNLGKPGNDTFNIIFGLSMLLIVIILIILFFRFFIKFRYLTKEVEIIKYDLKKQISIIENRLDILQNSTSSKTKNNNSEDIIKQLDELKKILEKENN